jgi:hypothetical protein
MDWGVHGLGLSYTGRPILLDGRVLAHHGLGCWAGIAMVWPGHGLNWPLSGLVIAWAGHGLGWPWSLLTLFCPVHWLSWPRTGLAMG